MVLDERPLSELFGHASGESSDGLVQLAATLRQLTALVAAEEAPSELQSAWRQVATILKEASCKVADLLAVASSAQSESGPAQAEKLLHELLQSWNRQLLALPKGGCALLPLAWTAFRAPRTAALAVLRREGDKGAFALLNLAGSGAEYHLRQLRGPLTRPRLCCCPVVAKAPWSRLCSSPFWLFMLRPVLGLQEDPHPALLYEALLPFLTKEERRAQLNRQMSYDWGVRWCPVPRSDDTKIHVVFEALALALQSSQPPAVAEWVLLLLRWRALKASPTASWEMCQALARRAAEVGEAPLPDPLPRWNPPEILEQLYAWLSSKMPEETAGSLKLPMSPVHFWEEDVVSEEPAPDSAGGSSNERPALVLPVPLVLVSCDTVQDYHLAAVALRSCVRGCALLLNQRGLVANADRHVVALVQHLFYEVLPMPLPPSRGVSACFWRSMPMYYEAQASLVREIWLLVQYFLAASLSLPLNTHHHSVRLLTLCSALAILDAVLRRLPPHTQNDLSRVYSGVLRSSSKASAFAVTAQLAQSTEAFMAARSSPYPIPGRKS
ncbi:unnamed protein product [Effrenium voratum]|nr:unnamed protein product [Effrenium voratum]